MKLSYRLALTACVASIAASSAAAQVTYISIPAQQDNTLYESATGDVSNAIGNSGYAGGNSGANKRRYLVQFDVAGLVPAGARITSARLHVQCTNVPNGATIDSYGTHRVLTAWGEGTSSGGGQGAPSTAGDATWIHTFYPASNWAAPGGDFNPVSSSSASINTLGPFDFESNGLLAETRNFQTDPASNFGWMIKANTEGVKTARGLASRENSNASMQPYLMVGYSLPSMTPFCDPASSNSSGGPAVLGGTFGSGVGSDLHLDVSGGPLPLATGSRMLGFFLVGDSPQPGIAVSDGYLCLTGNGGFWSRYNVAGTNRSSLGLFDAAGNLQNMVGTGGPSGYGFDVPSESDIPNNPPMIMAGDTYGFQLWYRDTLSGMGHSNFSNGLAVTF